MSFLSSIIAGGARQLRALAPLANLTIIFFLVALAGRLLVIKMLFPDWMLSVSGVTADLLAAAFAAAVLCLLRAVSPPIAATWLLLWLLLSVANVEHIYALNDALRLGNFRLALDANFVRGSLLAPQTWPFIIISGCGGWWLWWSLRQASFRPLTLVLCVLVAFSSAAISTPLALRATEWRHSSPMAFMLANTAAGWQQPTATAPNTDTNIEDFFRRDLSGKSLVTTASKPRNVLLIIMEGLTGAYLAQSRKSTEFTSPHLMSQFSNIADDAITVPNFVTHGAGTIGGLYAIYCGDYSQTPGNTESIKPFLFQEMTQEARPVCLPEILKQAGYATSYLQAADLLYMKKNTFLPLTGFEHVAGKGDFPDGDGNFWGSDDGGLFAAALDEINRLHAGKRPWFMSMLTVGTHHPYIAPDSYITAANGDRKAASIQYLDDIIASFVAELQTRGVLDDTLVIFTSDESHGVPGHPFGGNWGLFAALGAGISGHTQSGVFGQVDIALSVLDYLQLTKTEFVFLGRSVFRENPTPRPMLFGKFFSDSSRRIYFCAADYCDRYQSSGDNLFASSYQLSALSSTAADPFVAKKRALFARAGLFYGRGENSVLVFEENINLPLVKQQNQTWQLQLPAKTRVNVALEVENTGSAPAHFYTFWLENGNIPIKMPDVRLPPVPAASGISLNYSFYNANARNILLGLIGLPHKKKTQANLRQIKVQSLPSNNESFDVSHFSLWSHKKQEDDKGRDIFSKNTVSSNANSTNPYLIATHQSSTKGDSFIAPKYYFGEQLDFSNNGPWHHRLALATDWLYPEPWGIWSNGEKPALVVKLGDVDTDAEYEMRIKFSPYVNPPILDSQTLTFFVNQKRLGQQTYNEKKYNDIGVRIPGRLLNANTLNSFSIGVQTPFNPSKYNAGDGFAHLGVGIVNFQLSRVN